MKRIGTLLSVFAALCLAGTACKKKSEPAAEPASAPAAPTEPAATGAEPAKTPAEPARADQPSAEAAAAAETDAVEARLAFAQGTVESIEDAGPQPLAEGASIPGGTIVSVAEGGQAEIDLPDGSVVDLDELTELLVAEAFVEDGVRRVELQVLAGAAHFTVAPSDKRESYFRVKTENGTTEVVGTVFAVEVGLGEPTTDVLVLDGKVEVASAAARQIVEATPEAPKAVKIDAGAPAAADPAVVADAVARWQDWTDRLADALILRHAIDVTKPDLEVVAALAPARHPLWRVPIELRRARIAHRIAVLAQVVAAEELARAADAKARFELAKAAWQAKAAAERLAAIAAYRQAHRAAWAAQAEVRVQRHAALKETLRAQREAHRARLQARVVAQAAAASAQAAGEAAEAAGQLAEAAAQAGVAAAQAGVAAGQAGVAAGVGVSGAVVVTPGPGGGGAVVVTPGAGAAAAARAQAAQARAQAAQTREAAAQAREAAAQAREAAARARAGARVQVNVNAGAGTNP